MTQNFCCMSGPLPTTPLRATRARIGVKMELGATCHGLLYQRGPVPVNRHTFTFYRLPAWGSVCAIFGPAHG